MTIKKTTKNTTYQSNALVYQANALIEATYNITLNGLKLLRLIASMIDKKDEDFKEYTIKISDLLNLFGVKNQSQYIEIPKTIKELMSKVVVIYCNEKVFRQYPLLSMAEHNLGKGEVKIKIHPDLKPYFFDLNDNYTKYELRNILKLKSAYSFQIYELMKMNQYRKTVEYNLDFLKKILGTTSKGYERYFNFKKRVLEKAKRELAEKTDITFTYKEIKKGRKVESIEFNIVLNNKKIVCEEKNTGTINGQISLELLSVIEKFKKKTGAELHPNRVQKLIELKGMSKVEEYIENWDKVNYPGINDVAAVFYKAVENEYNFNKFKGKGPRANFKQREYSDEYYDSLYEDMSK